MVDIDRLVESESRKTTHNLAHPLPVWPHLKNQTLLISSHASAQTGHAEQVFCEINMAVVRGLEHVREATYTVRQSYAQWGNKGKQIHKIGVS